MSKSAVHFPGLNGIRAVAAVGVLISHVLQGANHLGLVAHPALQFGGTGVTIFFTLSGFLITYLLLQERGEYETVNLKQFYLRRILRIWPLYFAYLALVVLILGTSGETKYLLLFVLFLPNLAFNLGHAPLATAHLWSIGIEEQFYAFWPVVVSRVRRLVPFLVGLICVLIGLRVGFKLYSDHVGNKLPTSIAACMRFDCMATGALFAIAYNRRQERILKIGRSLVVDLAFWTVVVLSFAGRFNFFSLLGDNVTAIVTGLFIVGQIESKRRFTLLENPLMIFLGTISFGIYVYHPLVIEVIAGALRRREMAMTSTPVAVAVVFAITCAVAWVSFRVLERPFLALKKRFSPVESRPR